MQYILESFLTFFGILYVLIFAGYILIINALHSSFSVVSVPAIFIPFVFLQLYLLVFWIYMKKKNGRKEKKKFLTIAAVTMIPPLICAILLGINEQQSNFTNEKWLNHPGERVNIVDDFLNDYELKGMPKDEVTALLGMPTVTEDNKIVYYLGGERGFISIDSEWLVISFNSSGAVETYEIETG